MPLEHLTGRQKKKKKGAIRASKGPGSRSPASCCSCALLLRKSQITGDWSLTVPIFTPSPTPCCSRQQSASAYSLKYICLLTGASAVCKVCLLPNYYISSTLLPRLRHAQLLLPWATFAALPPCKRPFFEFDSCPIRLTGSTADSLSYGVIFRTAPFAPKLTHHIFYVGQQQLRLFALQSRLNICITHRVVAEPSSLRLSQICGCGYRQKRKGTFRPATKVYSNGREINKYARKSRTFSPTHEH